VWKSKAKVRRQHADHLGRLAVEDDRPPHDPGIAAEALQPEPMAQEQDGRGVRETVLRGESATDQRLDAQEPEEVPADAADLELHRLARAGQGRGVVAHGGDLFEDPGPLAQVLDLGRRHGGKGCLPVAADADQRQPLGLAIGQLRQEHAADHAEHRGVDRDAQRQGQHRHRRESGPRAQRPPPVAKVLLEAVHGTLPSCPAREDSRDRGMVAGARPAPWMWAPDRQHELVGGQGNERLRFLGSRPP
jgi:hypothetical protein